MPLRTDSTTSSSDLSGAGCTRMSSWSTSLSVRGGLAARAASSTLFLRASVSLGPPARLRAMPSTSRSSGVLGGGRGVTASDLLGPSALPRPGDEPPTSSPEPGGEPPPAAPLLLASIARLSSATVRSPFGIEPCAPSVAFSRTSSSSSLN